MHELLDCCTDLEELDLRDNHITGTIDASLALGLPKLSGIYLAGNELTG